MPIALGELSVSQDGSLIDLCGATLLWRTAEGLQASPSREALELKLDELNAAKPQCPVNLNTLVVPKRRGQRRSAQSPFPRMKAVQPRRTSSALSGDDQPYVYLGCGHVQGKHGWGHQEAMGGQQSKHKCPMCACESERIVQLSLGMEPAFHLDSASLDHAFNPCGHVASKATVR